MTLQLDLLALLPVLAPVVAAVLVLVLEHHAVDEAFSN